MFLRGVKRFLREAKEGLREEEGKFPEPVTWEYLEALRLLEGMVKFVEERKIDNPEEEEGK